MTRNNGMSLWRDTFSSPLLDFRRDFDRLFDDWLSPSSRKDLRTDSFFAPACDVEEEDGHYLLTLELAGVKKDDIKMEIVDNQVVITGERKNEARSKETGTAYSERRFGKFQRSFTLPAGIDVSKVEASYQDGVLCIVVPKAESAKPRQIKIGNGGGVSKFFGKLMNSSKEKEEQLSIESDKVAS